MSYCLNIPVAFWIAFVPKLIGKFKGCKLKYYRILSSSACRFLLQRYKSIRIYFWSRITLFSSTIWICPDSIWWLAWSIAISSLHTFLLLAFSIQLLRTVIAEREVEYMPTGDENSASYASSVINSSLNIFKYEDGKECLGILVLLIWIKIINYSRSPRYTAE